MIIVIITVILILFIFLFNRANWSNSFTLFLFHNSEFKIWKKLLKEVTLNYGMRILPFGEDKFMWYENKNNTLFIILNHTTQTVSITTSTYQLLTPTDCVIAHKIYKSTLADNEVKEEEIELSNEMEARLNEDY